MFDFSDKAAQVASLYLALVTSDRPLPEPAQSAIARWALRDRSRTGDDVLAALVRRTDASADVLTIGEASASASMKAAWLARPGRTAADIAALVAAEQRAAVLITVASHPDTPTELLDALVQDRRITVALAVLENSNASDAALLTAIPRAMANSSRRGAIASATAWVERRPDLHDALALSCTSDRLARLLLPSAYVSLAGARVLAELMFNRPLVDTAARAEADPNLFVSHGFRSPRAAAVVAFAFSALSTLTKRHLFDVDDVATGARAWGAIHDAVKRADRSPTMLPVEPQGLARTLLRAAGGDVDALEQYRSATALIIRAYTDAFTATGEHLADCVTFALSTEHTALLERLATSPNLTADVLGRIPADLRGESLAPVALGVLRHHPTTRTVDDDSMAVLLDVLSTTIDRRSLDIADIVALCAASSPERVVFVGSVLGSLVEQRTVAFWCTREALADARLRPYVLGSIRLWDLNMLIDGDPELGQEIAGFLTDELGTDAAAWETFETIAGEFAGSLAAAVRTARRL